VQNVLCLVRNWMAHLTQVLIACSTAMILEAESLGSPPGIYRIVVLTPFKSFEERCSELIFECAVNMNP